MKQTLIKAIKINKKVYLVVYLDRRRYFKKLLKVTVSYCGCVSVIPPSAFTAVA